MDSGLTVRPIGVTTQPGAVRPDVGPVREAVPTNLAPAQTVTAAAKPDEARQDALQSGTSDPSYVRKIILDAQSRDVIYRVIDPKSGRAPRRPGGGGRGCREWDQPEPAALEPESGPAG